MTHLSTAQDTTNRAVEIAATQQRTVQTLLASQVCAGVGLVSGVAVTVLLADDLTGSKTLAGLTAACLSVGSTAASFPLARIMARSGRRPGLFLGYLIGAVGALLAVTAALMQFFPLLPLGVACMGAGSASNLATRYAAADLAPQDKRASTIGLIVWASTFGAGFGSLVSLSVLDPAGRSLGFPDYVGSFAAGVLLLLAAAAIVQVRLRPDPLLVAGGVAGGTNPRLPLRTALRLLFTNAQARLAVLAMMISQATMVGTMSLTPLHMKDGHQSGAAIGFVLFGHMMGMFLFSPFVGQLADRIGRPPMLVGAGILCTVGAVWAGMTPPHGFAGIAGGQVAIGLAWCFGIIAASGLLTDAFPVEQRVSVQGAGDLCMSAFGALGGIAAGAIVAVRSYQDLNLGAGVLGVALVVAVLATGVARDSRRVGTAPIA
jgi:MFS family permease